jgi:hypothetical protein
MGGKISSAQNFKGGCAGPASVKKIFMKIFLDCDVLLDVMLGREKFFIHSIRVFDACETGEIQGAIA